MQRAYVVTGRLTNSQTVALDEALPIAQERVRVVVETLPREGNPALPDVLKRIRDRQQARGHHPSNKSEIDAFLQTERGSWNE